MSKRRDIVLRITEYLSNGGLFNPELMPHSDVRDLLLACRDEIIAARACAEMMLQGTGQKLGEELARRVMDEHYPPRWIPVEERWPDDRQHVIACFPSPLEFMTHAVYEKDQGWFSIPNYGAAQASHWMPLPEPPAA